MKARSGTSRRKRSAVLSATGWQTAAGAVNATVIGGNQANIGGIAGQIYDGSVDLADAFVKLHGGADSTIGGIVGDADKAQPKT